MAKTKKKQKKTEEAGMMGMLLWRLPCAQAGTAITRKLRVQKKKKNVIMVLCGADLKVNLRENISYTNWK